MSTGRTLVVFLHGSGGTGYEIRSFLDELVLKSMEDRTFTQVCESFGAYIITPTSDVKRFSAMDGERMNIWFDRTDKFFTLDGLDDAEDIEGVNASLDRVMKQIEEVESDYTKIFIGGHSMGGVLALHTLRKSISDKLRGVFCIGSCLVYKSAVFVEEPLGTTAQRPLLMMHGVQDDLVSVDWAGKTASTLRQLGVNVQFKTYPNAYHGLEDEQMVDLLQWMQEVLANEGTKVHAPEA